VDSRANRERRREQPRRTIGERAQATARRARDTGGVDFHRAAQANAEADRDTDVDAHPEATVLDAGVTTDPSAEAEERFTTSADGTDFTAEVGLRTDRGADERALLPLHHDRVAVDHDRATELGSGARLRGDVGVEAVVLHQLRAGTDGVHLDATAGLRHPTVGTHLRLVLALNPNFAHGDAGAIRVSSREEGTAFTNLTLSKRLGTAACAGRLRRRRAGTVDALGRSEVLTAPARDVRGEAVAVVRRAKALRFRLLRRRLRGGRLNRGLGLGTNDGGLGTTDAGFLKVEKA
jgi:hypothetical protein